MVSSLSVAANLPRMNKSMWSSRSILIMSGQRKWSAFSAIIFSTLLKFNPVPSTTHNCESINQLQYGVLQSCVSTESLHFHSENKFNKGHWKTKARMCEWQQKENLWSEAVCDTVGSSCLFSTGLIKKAGNTTPVSPIEACETRNLNFLWRTKTRLLRNTTTLY